MGKWRNRRRFVYQKEYKDPASSYYDHEDERLPPYSGFVEDGVPSWEKRFCELVGKVPWQKIVKCKDFMDCHPTVINWNDSAGEEAFQKEKKRFWNEINGHHCEISLPDPGMYIDDDINWNPYIDPDLIKDSEKAFFAPEEGDKDNLEYYNGNNGNFMHVPSEEWNRNPNEVGSNWGCKNNAASGVEMKDKAQCWKQWPVDTDKPSNSNNGDNPWAHYSQKWGGDGNQLQEWENNNLNNDENPWESRGYETVKGNNCGGCSDKFWGWNDCENQVGWSKGFDSSSNPWENNNQGLGHAKEKAWRNSDHGSWSTKQQEQGNRWRSNLTQGSGTSKDKQWRGWKQQDNQSREPKDLDFRQNVSNGSWGRSNDGFRKREGSHQYITGQQDDQRREPKDVEYRQNNGGGGGWGTSNGGHRKREGSHQYITGGNKHTRIQGNYNQTSHQWRSKATHF